MTLVVQPLYRKPVLPPLDIPNAYYGKSGVFTKTHSMVTSVLPNRLTIVTDQAIDITLEEGEYGWFYIRTDISNVQFMDLQLNIFGGWDGATWPDDGSIGDTTGSLEIIQASNGTSWQLFRTDFPATGQRTYRVYFDVPSDVEEPVDPEEPEDPEDPEEPVDPVPSTPIYGIGVLADYNEATIRSALTEQHTYTSGETITITASGSNYAYFAIPKSYNATFLDTAINFAGGWDGASWPNDGSYGETVGPVEIYISGQPWNLYRTDFPGVGTKTYRITF